MRSERQRLVSSPTLVHRRGAEDAEVRRATTSVAGRRVGGNSTREERDGSLRPLRDLRASAPPRLPRKRRAFTLLEVVIALGILSLGLMVLVDTQATSVLSTVEANRMLLANELAQEKLTEVMLLVEVEGFTEDDKSENGDFEDYGEEDWRGDDLDLEMEDLEEFHFEWTVRKIELTIPTDMASMMGDLEGVGYLPEEKLGDDFDSSGAPDLGDLGITGDMITDYLGDYIREVRVVVWWGDEEPDVEEAGQLPEDSVELLTHVINPTGKINPPLGAN